MDAQTPVKRGLMGRVESEGKKPKEKEQDGEADDIKMGGVEGVDGEQPKWKPRPVADPLGPIELGDQALFISKEKSDRVALN